MKKTLFIKNAFLLTVTGIILRLMGIFFKIWLASKVGAEGIGLYQLIFSVYTFASTFASFGVTVAVTRLVADEMALGNKRGVSLIMRKVSAITLLISALSLLVAFFGASFIAESIVGDIRSLASIRLLSFSLPFMGVSAVIKGYFSARRNALVNSSSIILEQICRIVLCLYFVSRFSVYSVGAAVAGVILGDVLAETISCIFLIFSYKISKKTLICEGERCHFKGTRAFLRIYTPITLGRYLTSLLRTTENIIVPKTFSAVGGDHSRSLALFGALKGMALPLLFFPSTLLSALSGLLIPEMSEALARKQPSIIKNSVSKILLLTYLFGVLFGSIFFFGGERIGETLYGDGYSGYLIKVLAPLVPLMYIDSMCDGILKGLDRQTYTFITSITDCILRIILILLFVPKHDIKGFLVIMYISNAYTCIMHLVSVVKRAGIRPKLFSEILIPAVLSVGYSLFFYSLLGDIKNNLLFIVAFCGCVCLSFIITILATGTVKLRDYI